MKPQDFIGQKATYFKDGTQIFGENEKGELQMILDVRGWGAIQNLFEGNLQKAIDFQDKLGRWLVDAINEKMERERKALSIADVMAMLPTSMINRVEVIDEKGRSYVNWKPTNKTELQIQDNGRTLKVFVSQGN